MKIFFDLKIRKGGKLDIQTLDRSFLLTLITIVKKNITLGSLILLFLNNYIKNNLLLRVKNLRDCLFINHLVLKLILRIKIYEENVRFISFLIYFICKVLQTRNSKTPYFIQDFWNREEFLLFLKILLKIKKCNYSLFLIFFQTILRQIFLGINLAFLIVFLILIFVIKNGSAQNTITYLKCKKFLKFQSSIIMISQN